MRDVWRKSLKTVPLVITTHAYIPEEKVNRKVLHKHYLHRFYKEEGCSKCPLVQDRPVIECETCPNYKGEIQLWREKTIKGKDYIALPPGRISKLEDLFKLRFKIDDRRKEHKLPYKIKFTGDLFTGEIVDGRKTVDQKEIVNKWLKTKNGMISAPPRSGKTVMAANGVTQLNVKTLIIAHQADYLRQFLRTFIGSKKRKPMTNIKELRKETGKPIIGIVKKPEDLKKYDIALMTYQKFIRKESAAKRIAKYLRGHFGLVIVDEVHRCIPKGEMVATETGDIYIEEVISGTKVFTFNQTTYKPELKILKRKYETLLDERIVTINHEKGQLRCTENHLVYTYNRGWVKAKNLVIEDELEVLSDEAIHKK